MSKAFNFPKVSVIFAFTFISIILLAANGLSIKCHGEKVLKSQCMFNINSTPLITSHHLEQWNKPDNSRAEGPDNIYWNSLGAGITGPEARVFSLEVFNSVVIAGGKFHVAGGVDVNSIAAWNGSSWLPIGSIGGIVHAMAVYNNELIVGGGFSAIGVTPANRIAAWNGYEWSALGSGLNDEVHSLVVYNNKLIAGGFFDMAGNVEAHRVAAWDGVSWEPMGAGFDGEHAGHSPDVCALAVYENSLIAGGRFTHTGTTEAIGIAAWDGAEWHRLGTGMGVEAPYVQALEIYNGNLIAGGYFSSAGDAEAHGIAQWDGSSWSSMGDANFAVLALATCGGRLVAGGHGQAGISFPNNHIGSWNGIIWRDMGSGVTGGNENVYSMTIFNGMPIIGGDFAMAGETTVNNIAQWNKWTYICGDFNNDQNINILDIVALINYLYKNGPLSNHVDSADVNSDLQLNILDVVYLINYKYKSGPKPDCP